MDGRWAKPENAEFLGHDSHLYPLTNMTINSFVDAFVRKLHHENTANPVSIRRMLNDGKFAIKVICV